MVAAFTVDRYEVQLSEVLHLRNAIHLNVNDAQDVINIQTVSKIFEEGVKLGFRDNFSGRVSFTSECLSIPIFIRTSLASRVKVLDFTRYCFPEADVTDRPYQDLNEAILSHHFPNLSKITILGTVELSESWKCKACLSGSHNEDILNEAEDMKSELVDLGLSGIDDYRSCVVVGVLWMSKPGTVYASVELNGQPKTTKKPRIARNPVAITHLPNTMSCQQFIRLNPSTD